MKKAIDAGRGALGGSGFVDGILAAQRRRMFDGFLDFRQGDMDGTTLHVGMQRGAALGKPNYLFAWAEPRLRAGMTSHELEARGQHALRLPFADNQFDWVFCNEAIEHAGSAERQQNLVQELYRIARKGVFLTTANRRHPIEFNSGLPLLHWLPDTWWRRILRRAGKAHWAEAAALNPVDSATLYRCAERLPGSPEHAVGHKRVWGLKAHFFLMVSKR